MHFLFTTVLTCVILFFQAVLLRVHNMHRQQLEQVLIALASAGEASYLAMARTTIDSMHGTGAQAYPAGSGNTNNGHSGSGSPQGVDVGEILYAKYQEFWVSIGNEVHYCCCYLVRLLFFFFNIHYLRVVSTLCTVAT